MKKFIFLLSLLLILMVSAHADLLLKDKLYEAQTGSWVVTEQNKNFTFLYTKEKTEKTVTFEQVVIPAARFSRQQMSWKEWFEGGAPGHTGWIAFEVDLQTGQLQEAYSYTHQGWIQASEADHFLTTLLNLPFHQVSEQDRRRIGTPPGYGKADRRPVWNPRLIVEGCPEEEVAFSVWKTRWPSDGSELSRKMIEIYLPASLQNPSPFPTFFPCWLEVEGKIGSAKIRLVDSGLGALSPRGQFPKRAPQIIGDTIWETNGLALLLQAPAYFTDFVLFAESLDDSHPNILLLPNTFERQGDRVTLRVSDEDLNKILRADEPYRLVIYPAEDPNLCLEAKSPILPRLSTKIQKEIK